MQSRFPEALGFDSGNLNSVRCSLFLGRTRTFSFDCVECSESFAACLRVLILALALHSRCSSLLRLGKDWKVVHELLLLYLLQVDTTESMNLSNVYASGGQDTKMKEAEANAGKYFRFPRGEPATTGGSGTQLPWNCPSAPKDGNAKCCYSFNLKQPHPDSAIQNGKCIYVHKCDQYLLGDDGKPSKEQCGSTRHGRFACDNPKRVTGGKQTK